MWKGKNAAYGNMNYLTCLEKIGNVHQSLKAEYILLLTNLLYKRYHKKLLVIIII